MPKVKGPKDGNFTNAQFDGASILLCKNIQESKCIVLISVENNHFCEGKYFYAIARDAVKKFGFVAFLIVDLPHWHNVRVKSEHNSGLSDSELKIQAKKIGMDWLLRNKESFYCLLPELEVNKIFNPDTAIEDINSLAIKYDRNFRIFRWDEWVQQNSGELNNKKQELIDLPTFQSAVNNSAQLFSSRHNASGVPIQLIKKASENYLIEETVGIIPAAVMLNYNFIAYPGDVIEPFHVALQFFEANIGWLHINFKRSNIKKEEHNEAKLVDPMFVELLYQSTNKSENKNENEEEIVNNYTEALVSIICLYLNQKTTKHDREFFTHHQEKVDEIASGVSFFIRKSLSTQTSAENTEQSPNQNAPNP